MLEKIKKIFKRKPKAKPKKVEEVLVLAEDKTFENEIVKPQENETVTETKSETKSSLTFGE
tara:strand:+ start:468 stop:650 length:183 start_codon:yes stop_codon:yes gene_type:complete